MRDAVAEAYKQLTGTEPAFIFSGWGGELDECELAVVENRLPDPQKYFALAAQPPLNRACCDIAEDGVCEALDCCKYQTSVQSAPAWHDAPNVAGLWVDGINLRALRFTAVDIGTLRFGECRWFGPIPEDTK
jgi:hypothetical protein